jgi:peptidyl-prolyl cis-trans isomerase B (cyclophilin B)
MKQQILVLMGMVLVFGMIGCDNVKQQTESNIVVFETNMGNFEVTLDPVKAPISSENFKLYVKSGFYDGLIFHRVMDGFMVQGGGFDQNMQQKQTNAPIKNEAGNGLKNEKYTIAMARTNVVDSATSQFFINVGDNVFLNHRDESIMGYGYAVFGKVSAGTEVIDKIKAVPVKDNGMNEVSEPIQKVIITKAYMK